MVEHYIVGDMVGVLYSVGFGAGWSTWNEEYPEIAVDKRIIKWLINNVEFEIDEHGDYYFKSVENDEAFESYLESLGYKNLYYGGADEFCLSFYPKGTAIRIDEYDGSESVVELEDDIYITL